MTLAPMRSREAVAGERPAPRVTYVVSRWGEPTQTFVRREAEAAAASGARVRARSLKPPRPCGLGVPVRYLPPRRVAGGFVRTAVRHPVATARVIGTVVWRSSPRNVVPQLAAAIVGLAWATDADGDTDTDLVHAHFGWVASTAAWAMTRVTGTPYAIVLHAYELHARRYQDPFASVPLGAAAQVFTISGADAKLVARRARVRPRILRMGVSDEWLDPPPRRSSRDPRLLVSVGSLVPKKGHAVLLDAVARTRHPYRLVIAGDGPDRNSLVSYAAALGIGERVEFRGSCAEADVRALLDQAAAFALACVVSLDGDRDGVPVVLMEAMARGVPVVTTDVGGIGELVGDDGFVVRPRDAGALAAALDRCAVDDESEFMTARARARIAARHRSSDAARLVVALAEEVRCA